MPKSKAKAKDRVEGGIIAFIGYILSPLSWWNDVFVNIPISYVLASVTVFFISKEYFPIAFIVYYNFTNVLGFILMHIGAEKAIKGKTVETLSKKTIIKYIVVSAFYTLLVYALASLGFLEPVQEVLPSIK